MRAFFRLATGLLSNLKFSRKFTIVGIIVLLPLAATLYLLASEINTGIEFAKKERTGVTYNMLLMDIMSELQRHRGATTALLSGDASFKDAQLSLQSHLDQDMQTIDATDKVYGAALKTTERWQAIKAKWADLKKRTPSLSPEEGFKSHTLLIEDILSLIAYVGETSNLRFDPHPDSFYLMDAVVYKLPVLSEHLGQTRAIGSGIAAKKRIVGDERTRLIILSGLIKSAADINSRNFDSVFRESPELKSKLEKDANDSADAINVFLRMLNKEFIRANRIELNAHDYFSLATNTIDAVFNAYNAAAPALDKQLDARIVRLSKKRNIAWAVAIFAMLLVTYIFMAFFISIVPPLRELTGSAEKIASGDLKVNIDVRTKDELGTLSQAFNSMAVKLKESFDEQKKMYNKVQLKAQQLAILQEAVASIASHLSIEPLLERLAMLSALLVKAELSAIVVLHPETGAIQYFKANIPLEEFPVKTLPKGKGLLGAALLGAAPIRLTEASADPRFKGLPSGHPFIGSFMGIPMLLANKVIGGIYAANKTGGAAFTQEDEDMLFMLALQAATAIENARLYTKTAVLATTDGLTGLLNRRAFMERLTEETGRSSRYEHYFSFLLLDIDHFKWINDTYGHPAGDAVLKSLAQILKNQVRSVDIVGRYGGEEFTIILPETDSAGARLVGDRIRSLISKMPFTLSDGSKIGLTVSIGISCYPSCSTNVDLLIEKADSALYSAKKDGRNKVYLYRETLRAQLENDPDQIAVLLNSNIGNIDSIITAIDVKASFFREHAEKVKNYALLIADAIGLSEKEKESLRFASLLHDIGFVAITTTILKKPDNLTIEELDTIKPHAVKGAEIIEKVGALKHLAPIIRGHHEKYDGSGYPDGLKAEAIPYLSRILAVADAFATMTSDFPWSKAVPKEEALKKLKGLSGTQFDPEMVKAFCRIGAI